MTPNPDNIAELVLVRPMRAGGVGDEAVLPPEFLPATAEIVRAQFWQRRKIGAKLEGGGQADAKPPNSRVKVHAAEIAAELGEDSAAGRAPSAAKLPGEFVRADELDDFLTLRAMDLLNWQI